MNRSDKDLIGWCFNGSRRINKRQWSQRGHWFGLGQPDILELLDQVSHDRLTFIGTVSGHIE